MNNKKRERGEHGWYKPGPRSYARLMKSDAVRLLAQSYPSTSREGELYQLQHFLEINHMGPEEILALDEKEIKKYIRRAVLQKNSEGHNTAAKRLFYVAMRFFELNGKELSFSRTEKKTLLKRTPKRIAKQYIPTREDIYRMVDAAPNKGPRQQSRARAIILCLWQSGVRASCLCSWIYGMFKDQLYPTIKAPIEIKVVANRPEGATDCGQDTKLSSYNVGYYYTFLHEEAAQALKAYLEERMADGWNPKDSDPIFVTEGPVSIGNPVNSTHLLGVVKSCAEQIGISPDSIWTHCLRKAFRKTLYRGGVDPDVAEALMGHKLPGSRGSYFDYHDVNFAREQYIRGYWSRISEDHIRKLEKRVAEVQAYEKRIEELEQKNQELKTRLNGYSLTEGQMHELLRRIEKLEKQAQK